MKLILVFTFLISLDARAFDLKGMVEKAAQDEKMQEQAKDLAKKGYEYFQGKKEDKKKEETVKAASESEKAAVQ